MKSIKPRRLEEEATIAVVTPSSPLLPDQLTNMNKNLALLKRLGYKIRFSKHFNEKLGHKAGSVEHRIADLEWAFENDDINAIICGRGGYNSNDLLDELDYGMIRKNPKIFCGYSDITFLHCAILSKTGLTTFYGPSAGTPLVLPWEGEGYTFKRLLEVLSPVGKTLRVKPSDRFSSNYYLDSTILDSKRTKWKTLRQGRAKGQLVGGQILTILNLAGTSYLPSFKDKILFWEDTESATAITERFLTQLKMLGVFDEINGMIVGRVNDREYRIDDAAYTLHKVILDATKGYDFPIISDMDFGHSVPVFTIPYGVKAEMKANPSKPELEFLEPAVV
jgi:muramoyltetrapeptide carboxypeptidase